MLEKESLFKDDIYSISLEILDKKNEIIFRTLSEHCGQYTDTVVSKEKLKEAITKQTAMKPKLYYHKVAKCFRCGKTLSIIEHDYCPQCGQKIDWASLPEEFVENMNT